MAKVPSEPTSNFAMLLIPFLAIKSRPYPEFEHFDFETYEGMPPPKNSSHQARNEINFLISLQPMRDKEAEERYPDNSYMGREAERRGKEIARMSNQITSYQTQWANIE